MAVGARQPGEVSTHRGTAQKVVIVSETRNGIKDSFQEAQSTGRYNPMPALEDSLACSFILVNLTAEQVWETSGVYPLQRHYRLSSCPGLSNSSATTVTVCVPVRVFLSCIRSGKVNRYTRIQSTRQDRPTRERCNMSVHMQGSLISAGTHACSPLAQAAPRGQW